MRYFYAKLGRGNSLASDCLSGSTDIGQQAVPIFFNGNPSNRAEFEQHGGAKEQGANFFWCEDNPHAATIVVIHDGHLHLARPTGNVIFRQNQEETPHLKALEYTKYLPIKVELVRNLSEVPPILSSLTANAYYYTGTFREISDAGCTRALQTLLERPVDPFDHGRSQDLLECLSSIELETLVAKIFEESGCFVPAYRGGAIKGIDIFARNLSSNDVELGHIVIAAGESISIQVKRYTNLTAPPKGCDFLISLSRDSDWIISSLHTLETTRRWFLNSLDWLPSGTLNDFGLGH